MYKNRRTLAWISEHRPGIIGLKLISKHACIKCKISVDSIWGKLGICAFITVQMKPYCPEQDNRSCL